MAAPALLGIPWLAAVIGSVISGLVSFFGKWFSKRVALTLAAVTAVVAVTAGFIGVIEGLIAAIQYAAPDTAGWFLFIPGNFSACLSAIITGKIARWAYEWNVKIIQWKLF